MTPQASSQHHLNYGRHNQMTEIKYTTEAMQFFNYAHLPESMQAVSRPFAELAYDMIRILPDNEQRRIMLQKLIEAKDCAVRAFIATGGRE